MSETQEASDYIFKIICVGDAAVGKSALAIRFAHNKFSESYTVTLGMNLVTRNIKLENKKKIDFNIEMTIWDIGGQPNFKTILPMYYKGALGALVVYDLTNLNSFENIIHWIDDVNEHCPDVPLIVIGNKQDLVSERAISEEQGKEITEKIKSSWKNDVHFIETSAKEGINVKQAFIDLAKSILKMVEEEEELEAQS